MIIPWLTFSQRSAWLGVRTHSQINEKWRVSTFTESRVFLEKFRPERSLLEVSPQRSLGKVLAVALPVRFTAFDKPQKRRHEVRLGLQAFLKANVGSLFSMKYRSFYQWDKTLEQVEMQKSYWRHKVDLTKRWNKRLASGIEQEFWHDFTASGKIDRYRLVMSQSIHLNERKSLYIAFLTQSPIFQNYTNFEKVYVLRWVFRL